MFINDKDDQLMLSDFNQRSQTKLHDKYKKIIYGFFYKKINNYIVAEELTCECLIKIFTKIHTYKKEVPFNSWVYRIINNHLIDYYKKINTKKHKREIINIDDVNQDYRKIITENTYHVTEIYEIVIKEINNTNNLDSKLFKMKFIDNYSLDEISSEFNLPKNKINRKILQFKKRLNKKIKI